MVTHLPIFVLGLICVYKTSGSKFQKKYMMEKKSHSFIFVLRGFHPKKKWNFHGSHFSPFFLGTRKNCRVHLDDRNGHFPCVACPAASDLRGSGEVEIPIIPRFQGNQGLVMLETPKIKEAKVAKAEKDAKKPKKQSNTKCINFFYPKKNVPVPSHSVSFPPSHRGNCLTLEKLPTQKSCRPKKNAPNKKNSPVFFCYPQTSPGWVCRQFLLPFSELPGPTNSK